MDYSNLPIDEIQIHGNQSLGPFEWWRCSIGHGGVNSLPLPEKVQLGARKLTPRLFRIFIQEFFYIYPDHGVYDFRKLDEYMDSMAATGAKVVAAICIKPKCLYPEKDQSIFMPNNIGEWQELIHTLVHRYSVERKIVTHWEIGNETDIGEWGGCPYLIKDPADYYKYYDMTIQPILKAFPEAKVGGPALAIMTEEFTRGFAELCKKNDTPLDFVTWHRYTDNPEDHIEDIAKAVRALECYGANRPELMITEFGKAFDKVSVEELAFHPARPAIMADNIFTVLDSEVDWTFYYHIWDQHNFPPEFAPFYQDPYIMQKHWNEIPHRFGLFGVNGEVRPTYFVYRMLAMAGDTMIQAESNQENLKVKAFTGLNKAVSAMIINRGDKGLGDRIITVKYDGLMPGLRTLKNYRLDGNKNWNEETLDLYPVEQRKVYVDESFECQIYCPADSVSMLCLE
jgi:xylan 1,4-beta-xylosidase